MKTIEVKITAEFKIPDEWEITDHVPDSLFPEDKMTVLKINGEYYDFFPECLMKVDAPETVIWSADEGRTEEVIDCMSQFRVRMQEKK
ncbi:MAG: hypothetical protein GY710_27240 [Desulfobacteraceae bacterium]|nr:hypothetical protein [Desulfobacteraceae bacterium]